jgi:hypothetical protein
MKVKIIISFVVCLFFLTTNISWAISSNKALIININIASKSKLGLNSTNITLSDDPEVNTTILTDLANVTSKTRTGSSIITSLNASIDLINRNGDVIPITKTLASATNEKDEISWKKVDGNLFQGDIMDTLIMNLDYKNNNGGPYSAVVKYTLVTP